MSEEASNPVSHTVVQCISAIAQHHGLQVSPDRIVHDFALGDQEPAPATILRIANVIGLKAKIKALSWDELFAQRGVFPTIALMGSGKGVIVVGLRPASDEGPEMIAIINPSADMGNILWLDQEKFCTIWEGKIVFLKRTQMITDEKQPFGLTWFVPEILKQRAAFRDIAIAALCMTVLALASPMFFQIVIDKVLVHQSISTLDVLTIGIVFALAFEAGFGYLRQILLLSASNKIDMSITRKAFSHLLSLPIDYFESTSAGVVTRNMLQLESIRNFLTGRLFFTALDTVALVIYLPILFFYSFKLALIVLAFSLVIAAIILAMLPTYRRQLQAVNEAEGKRQSLLIETIHGMRTVKALAIEPAQRRAWDQLSAESITRHFRVAHTSITGVTITDFLGKMMPITIIFVGAHDVFDHGMSVGVLIAFQMLSSRVSGPLMQIVGLINDYQQTRVAVDLLGQIMNRAPEGRGSGGLRPILRGEIVFDNVVFRYPGASNMALDRTSFKIPAGTVVGIVGRSGSGKTTLTKLIQGLYAIQEGIIRFDGVDAREIDLSHLRKQIGVVLQENFLFRGTVRENIMATKPEATFDEVVAACRAAGADEFIERMPQGYDTLLEEGATNLSGGQRQRLSIARCLLAKPGILILDEAASALDPESEAIFIRNLSQIAVGRTVVMISHRLSTLVNANTILVMHQGKLADAGRHKELLSRCETYQHLWNQQTQHL